MCKMCEPTKKEIAEFEAWANANPFGGDEQVEDGLSTMLYSDGRFEIAANFDGGYIGDNAEFQFKYCPYCGRKF